jgi:acetylornithine/succinyldiaminopimelate/putrescine aminotransferase
MGLMVGATLNIPGKDIVEECFRQGLIINCTQETVLRIMPALNVTKRQIDRSIHMMDDAFAKITEKA